MKGCAISEKNTEAFPSARNAGVREAKGAHIAFLDSDDRYRKDKLEVTAAYIQNNPDYKIFHTEEVWVPVRPGACAESVSPKTKRICFQPGAQALLHPVSQP